MSEMNIKKPTKANTIATAAVLASLALIFSYIEFLVPLSLGLPGIKLGLANIVIVIALYGLGTRTALLVNVTRILLAAALFGSVFSALYSLAGGLISFAAMAALKRTGFFSTVGVSMAGGVFHNMGQLLIAALLVESYQIFYYFPLLLLAGLATGIINGIIATLILRALSKSV